MRFMVMVRAESSSEAGVMPTAEQMAAMGRFNEELVKAGVLQAADGLHRSAEGVRVRFSGKERTVTHGPFPVEQVVAGYWLWTCASQQEAIEWVKRCPNPMPGDSDIEIRQVFEAEEFEAMTSEVREQEERLRAQLDKQRTAAQGRP